MNATENKKAGFVNGAELKKNDVVEFEIKRLGGVDYDPPAIHRGTVVTPIYSTRPYWVVQIQPEHFNPSLPDWDLGSSGIMAIYGDSIVRIV